MKKILFLSLFLLGFQVLFAQVPTITSFSPTQGPVGTIDTINGTNFSTIPANNIVFYGAVRATVNSSTATRIIAKVPIGTSYQPITITVNGLTAYSSKPFLVTFTRGDSIIILPSFYSKVDFSVGTGYSGTTLNPYSLCLGDIDGDGKLDIVVVFNNGNNRVSVYKNTSTPGTISFASGVNFITGSMPISISIVDIDRDGKPDLVVINSDNTISVLRNTSSSGSISFASRVDFATGNLTNSVSIGDIDGDGKPDLVFANPRDTTVAVLRNTSSSGSISFASRVDFATGSSPYLVNICDIDMDGKPDLIVANSQTKVSVLRNTSSSGSISFASKVDFATITYGSSSINIGDIDGDGKPDIAFTENGWPTILVYRNTSAPGSISFTSRVDSAMSSFGEYLTSIGDLNGDGKPDLAVLNSDDSTVSVLRNTSSSGSISFASKVDFATGTKPLAISIGDIDGDGKPDLVILNNKSQTVSVLRNTMGSYISNNIITGKQLICSSTSPDSLKGSQPFVGNVKYSYLWLSSSLDSLHGFVAASGIDTLKNYKPYVSSFTRWFRRQVTSTEGVINISNAIEISHPLVKFIINDTSQCLKGNNFIFTDKSSKSSGSYTRIWDFGNSVKDTSANKQIKYAKTGTYFVKLKISTNLGCKDSLIKIVIVNPNPIANFSINDSSQCQKGNNFVFTNNSSISSGTFNNLWKFGDNSTSTNTSPSHSYLNTGTYFIIINITSNFGCKDSLLKNVIVNTKPTIVFAISDTSECLKGNNFMFNNYTTGAISYLWEFGDKATTTNASPSHSYSQSNKFPVKLIATSNYNCLDSITKNLYVRPNPASVFAVNDSQQCLKGNYFSFTNNSTISSGTFNSQWKIENTNSNVYSTTHTFKTDGIFAVALITTSDYGCKDSASKNISVIPSPVVLFTINDTSQCIKNNKFIFTNKTTIDHGTLIYHWEFGDGDTSVINNPTYIYKNANTYPVKLVATSSMGCYDQMIKNVYVNKQPKVNLGKDITIKDNQSVDLHAGSGYDSYLWSNHETDSTITIDAKSLGIGTKVFWVWVIKNGCSGFDTINVTIIDSTTSVKTNTKEFDVLVYPNPTNDVMNVEINGLNKDIIFKLTDLYGRLVKELKIIAGQKHILENIDLSEMGKGVYILNIMGEEGNSMVKVVKY